MIPGVCEGFGIESPLNTAFGNIICQCFYFDYGIMGHFNCPLYGFSGYSKFSNVNIFYFDIKIIVFSWFI